MRQIKLHTMAYTYFNLYTTAPTPHNPLEMRLVFEPLLLSKGAPP